MWRGTSLKEKKSYASDLSFERGRNLQTKEKDSSLARKKEALRAATWGCCWEWHERFMRVKRKFKCWSWRVEGSCRSKRRFQPLWEDVATSFIDLWSWRRFGNMCTRRGTNYHEKNFTPRRRTNYHEEELDTTKRYWTLRKGSWHNKRELEIANKDKTPKRGPGHHEKELNKIVWRRTRRRKEEQEIAKRNKTTQRGFEHCEEQLESRE